MFQKQFRVRDGAFSLKKCEPAYTGSLTRKEAEKKLMRDVREMQELQDRFYAYDRYALLMILQAPDAAGKDGTVKHVMSGLNPAGCDVVSFKAPTSEELDHDFLWRHVIALPRRGHIGIFNRSYYEEVLVVRVIPELLKAERLPSELVTKHIWKERFEDINAFERYLTRNGTVVLKFFLNVSKEEQKKRILARINDPAKNWKFTEADLEGRAVWDEFQSAYADMLRSTSTDYAPWYVIPADHKWFARVAVADIVVRTLRDLNPTYPPVTDSQRRALMRAKQILESE